jgi:hypothetical protein
VEPPDAAAQAVAPTATAPATATGATVQRRRRWREEFFSDSELMNSPFPLPTVIIGRGAARVVR